MKINVKKNKEIKEALEEVQNRCKSRLMNEIDVQNAADNAERHLDTCQVPKNHRKGASFSFIVGFGGRQPASYKGMPESTMIYLQRSSKDWFMTKVKRVSSPSQDTLIFNNIADYKDIIIEKLKSVQ